MNLFYELVGRIVVTFVRIRYRQEIRLAAAVVVIAAAAAGYAIATRESEEA